MTHVAEFFLRSMVSHQTTLNSDTILFAFGGSDGNESACNAGDLGAIPG